MTSTKRMCRLCLDVIPSSFESLNPSKLKMLKLVSLDLDVSLSENPLVCSNCLDILQQSFDFKMTCLNNQNFLKTFCNTGARLTLEEIVVRDKLKKGVKCERESVCRFCLKYLDSVSLITLDKVDEDVFLKDMLGKCLPEIDLHITSKPVICQSCMDNLENLFNFMIDCSDKEETIKNCMSARGTDGNDHFDLNNVLKFLEDMKQNCGTSEPDLNCVKLETVDIDLDETSLDATIKTEEDEELEQIEEDNVDGSVREDDSTLEPEKALELDSEPTYEEVIVQQSKGRKNNQHKLRNHRNRGSSVSKEYVCTTRSENYTCNNCEFKCSLKHQLRRHMEKHTIKKSYPCGACSYVSLTKCSAQLHKKKHKPSAVNEFPFGCKSCGKTFTRQLYLDGHILTHHDDAHHLIKTRVYSCESCDYQTVHKLDLPQHECDIPHSNSPFKCDKCEFVGLSIQAINIHRNVHLPYKCVPCSHYFNEKDMLRVHLQCRHGRNVNAPNCIKVINANGGVPYESFAFVWGDRVFGDMWN